MFSSAALIPNTAETIEAVLCRLQGSGYNGVLSLRSDSNAGGMGRLRAWRIGQCQCAVFGITLGSVGGKINGIVLGEKSTEPGHQGRRVESYGMEG